MKRVLWLGMLIAAQLASAQSTHDWRAAAVSGKDPRELDFVALDTVEKSGAYVDAFVLRIWDKRSPVPLMFSMVIEKREVNCTNGAARSLAMQMNLPEGGEPVRSLETSAWRVPPATSVNALTIAAICGQRPYETETISNPIEYASRYFARAPR